MRMFLSFASNASGAAAAEMALLTPLLAIMLFAGIEGGAFMWSEHKVVKGVRDGARFAGRQPFSQVDCDGNTFVSSTIVDAIKNVTRSGYASGDNPAVDGGDNPVIGGWEMDDVTVTVDCDDTLATGIYAELDDGAPRVTVSASVAYPSVFGALGFPTQDLTMNASAQAAVMGL